MKAVVQRVMQANVSVDGEVISSIGRGLCVFVGISTGDSSKDSDFMKLINLRLFDDVNGKRWMKSVKDCNYEILCISQAGIACQPLFKFTLCGRMKKNKPDFHLAMSPQTSEPFYADFMQRLRLAYDTNLVKDGKFAAYMQVNLQNDGPVTMILESPISTPQQTCDEDRKRERTENEDSSEEMK